MENVLVDRMPAIVTIPANLILILLSRIVTSSSHAPSSCKNLTFVSNNKCSESESGLKIWFRNPDRNPIPKSGFRIRCRGLDSDLDSSKSRTETLLTTIRYRKTTRG